MYLRSSSSASNIRSRGASSSSGITTLKVQTKISRTGLPTKTEARTNINLFKSQALEKHECNRVDAKPDTAPIGAQRSRTNETPPKPKLDLGRPSPDTPTPTETVLNNTKRCSSSLESLLQQETWPDISSHHEKLDGVSVDRPFSHVIEDAFNLEGVFACVRCRTPLFDASKKETFFGGFSGFRYCNVGSLVVFLVLQESVPKVLARCKTCGALVGEIIEDGCGVGLRSQWSSLHFLKGDCAIPEWLCEPVSKMSECNEDIEPDSIRVPVPEFIGSREFPAKPKEIGKGFNGGKLLEYSNSESDSGSESDPILRKKARCYDIELFSDESSDDS